MKDKVIIVFMGMSLGLFGCTLGVNEVNPQASKSIEESKNDGFFINEYMAIQEPKRLFDIVEVWEEKVWYNKVINLFKKTKVASGNNSSWIVIKTKETSQSPYVYANYSTEWQLSESGNLTSSVGYAGGLLTVSLKETVSFPDSLRLVLKKGQEQIGILTLIRKH
ncbi:MAG: hypothetical protein BGO31_16735 [Bacteroidetes bacterium 43-16]|nr:MAG: hypothetical protein BGO31_16735 [Bacteroidetes bacterium 43-16]